MTGMTGRLRSVIDALGGDSSVAISRLPDELARCAGPPRHSVSYLIMSAIAASIPESGAIKPFTRQWRLDGLEVIVRQLTRKHRFAHSSLTLRIVTDRTVVDVTDTLGSNFTTGIQRVARETIGRWWAAGHELTLVRWDSRGRQLISLDADEIARLVPQAGTDVRGLVGQLIIPFETTFVLPEISVAAGRTARLRTISRYAGGRTTAIGFDCIPITSAETAAAGMPGAFSKYLGALARFDVVAPISEASATEYRGWRRMLAGTGIGGPVVHTVTLPFTTSGQGNPDRARLLRAQLGLGELPIVLCVGSHEPRKNHLALLHAAELAWRGGEEFALVMVGGNSWDTDRFERLLAYLRRRDRRVLTLSGVDDTVIWDLYDLARVSVFCSLNEGFGLPVVESLSHGTPVVTSDFGSMRSLGAGHGALLVDPRDIRATSAALISLLSDDAAYAQMTEQTRSLPQSSWESYSQALWQLANAKT